MKVGHLSSFDVNRAAREVAARVVSTPPPLTVPLADPEARSTRSPGPLNHHSNQ